MGFQGGSWISAHLDDIRVTTETALALNALSAPISDLFYKGNFVSYEKTTPLENTREQDIDLHEDAKVEIEDLKSLEINEQTISEQNIVPISMRNVSDNEQNVESHMIGEEMEIDLEQLNSQINSTQEPPYAIPMEVDNEVRRAYMGIGKQIRMVGQGKRHASEAYTFLIYNNSRGYVNYYNS